jgi:hypothetical protein
VPAPAESNAEGEPRLAPVEITGKRPDDVQERRNSTAAKIIIGRDEIERFGDSTVGELHRAGVEPESVLVRRSSLEDVFLRLTGRSLVE